MSESGLSHPKLSVVLPVYNGLPYLEAALSSVLHQSFHDFELIVVNDGSTDGSDAIIEKLDDPRVRYLRQPNKGLSATLNRGISIAKGRYIARQDQDDISFPLRFQKQVDYLDTHANVGMLGAWAEIWVGNDPTTRLLKHPTEDAAIRFGMLFDNYFVHSSVMLRRTALEEVGGYSEDRNRQPPEDYELWSRIMRTHMAYNLPEVLMAYREVPTSMSRVVSNPFVKNVVKISAENISRASHCAVDSPEVVALSNLYHGEYSGMPSGVAYAKMQSVLTRAITRIAEESGVSMQRMRAISLETIHKLHYRYIDYRSSGLIGKVLHSSIGQRTKNVVRRILYKDSL